MQGHSSTNLWVKQEHYVEPNVFLAEQYILFKKLVITVWARISPMEAIPVIYCTLWQLNIP